MIGRMAASLPGVPEWEQAPGPPANRETLDAAPVPDAFLKWRQAIECRVRVRVSASQGP